MSDQWRHRTLVLQQPSHQLQATCLLQQCPNVPFHAPVCTCASRAPATAHKVHMNLLDPTPGCT
jgi:hypothetical protein